MRIGCRYRTSLAQDEGGSAAVEFAIVAATFFFLLFSMIETGAVMLANSILEMSIAEASRMGAVGYKTGGLTKEDIAEVMMESAPKGFMSSKNLNVTMKSYKQFDQIGKAEPYEDENANDKYDNGEPYDDLNANGRWDEDMGLPSAGNSNDIVLYEISYDWQLVSPMVRSLIGNDGVVTLSANLLVKNEPYGYLDE